MADKKDSTSIDYPEFQVPAGFELPTGTGYDEEFETVATFKVREDGTMCVTKIMGMPIASLSNDENADSEYSDDSDGAPMSFDQAIEARIRG